MIRNLIVAFSLSMLVAACGKDDTKPADDKPAAPAPKPTAATPPAAPPSAPVPTPVPAPAPAAGGSATTFTDNADYEAKGLALMNSMIAVFAADGTDCAKLATDITKFIGDNQDKFSAFKAYETAHPEAKKEMETKSADVMKDFMAKATPRSPPARTTRTSRTP